MESLYQAHDGCQHDEISLSDDAWKSIIDDLAKQLYEGNYTKGLVPWDIYFKTASKLAESIVELGSSYEYDSPANALSARLRANLYQFSGAKSLTEANAFRDMLIDESGNLKQFNQYRQDVEQLHGLYNEWYLSAEYQNAIASAQSADQWLQWSPEDWLEYRTVGDDRVRPAHALLDGLTLQASSPVWNRIYPPNDWLCRCNVAPADKPKNPVSEQEAGKLGKAAVTNEMFNNNPGKSGIVFKDDHPYFESTKGIKEVDAVKNYGMKKVETIMANKDLFPAVSHTPTETDYYIWWKDMVAAHPASENSFAIKDKMGNHILFSASPDGKKKNAFFRDHILDNEDKRHQYAKNLVDIIQKPDEIWYNYNKKSLSAIYVKYYSDAPYVVRTSVEDNIIKAETMHKADKKEVIDKLRKGVLVYKK